jgi:hypothetical protein
VIADACNSNYPGTGPAPTGIPLAAALLPAVVEDRRLISLFRTARGTVLIAGSEGNNYSFYQVSGPKSMGFFTRQLLDDVIGKMNVAQDTTWNAVGAQFREMDIQSVDPIDGRLKTFKQKPFLDERGPFATVRTADGGMSRPIAVQLQYVADAGVQPIRGRATQPRRERIGD